MSIHPAAVTASTDTIAVPASSSDLGRDALKRIIPELREHRWQLLSYHVTGVQRHRQKRLVYCQMAYRHAGQRRIRKASLVIKYYGGPGGDIAFYALQQLFQAGFTPSSRYRVPRPYGYQREPAILIQESVSGREWLSLLLADRRDSKQASERAAQWLIRLQKSALATDWLAEKEQREMTMEVLQDQIQELALSFPLAAPRLEIIGQQLLRQCTTLANDALPVPSHGDYHGGNVLLTPTMTTVIDFDAFGLRDASFDAGYCIAQLLSMSYFRSGSLAAGAKAAARFWLTYSEQGGQAPWSRVAIQVSATLLQILHYTLCAMHSDRVDILPWWLDMVELWINSTHPAVLECFSDYGTSPS